MNERLAHLTQLVHQPQGTPGNTDPPEGDDDQEGDDQELAQESKMNSPSPLDKKRAWRAAALQALEIVGLG